MQSGGWGGGREGENKSKGSVCVLTNSKNVRAISPNSFIKWMVVVVALPVNKIIITTFVLSSNQSNQSILNPADDVNYIVYDVYVGGWIEVWAGTAYIDAIFVLASKSMSVRKIIIGHLIILCHRRSSL